MTVRRVSSHAPLRVHASQATARSLPSSADARRCLCPHVLSGVAQSSDVSRRRGAEDDESRRRMYACLCLFCLSVNPFKPSSVKGLHCYQEFFVGNDLSREFFDCVSLTVG